MRMVCLGNLCMVWFLPRQLGCSRNALLRATTVTLAVEHPPSRVQSTHERDNEICARAAVENVA